MRVAITFLFVLRWFSPSDSFDSASSCARASRAGRARPPHPAPCDLSKEPYCSTPGTNYPWQAIRSFIRENQGLMRRMYGDERHITILKAELENFIEDSNIEEIKESNFKEDVIRTTMMYTKQGRGLNKQSKPHFRPIQDKNKKVVNDTLLVQPLQSNTYNGTKYNSTDNSNSTNVENNETLDDGESISYKTKLESIANIELNDLEPNVVTLETVIKQSIETNRIYPKPSSNAKPEAIKNNLKPDNVAQRNVTNTTSKDNSTDTTSDGQYESTTDVNKDNLNSTNGDTSTLPPTLLFSVHEKIDRIDTNINDKREEFVQKPPLHQERPSVIKLGGENACETRQTLEAPFWANNTKNELLALVNMYPFEQYIHMETCVHEKKQMYCREGCRCEQQFRLHRLLAYDPHNDCRGIFADWFNFPVCCVCKCYDVPVEFRARAPRILPPRYDENIRRALYSDAVREWYDLALDDELDVVD